LFDVDFCNVNWVLNLKKLMFLLQHRLTQARIPMKQANSPQKQLIEPSWNSFKSGWKLLKLNWMGKTKSRLTLTLCIIC